MPNFDEMRARQAVIANMFKPVRCARCSNGVYDLGKVEVTARYTDCSVWKTPCCGAVVDDRGETGWTSRQDYYVINKETGFDGRMVVDQHGMRIEW